LTPTVVVADEKFHAFSDRLRLQTGFRQVLPGLNKRYVLKISIFKAELGIKTISPAASFVLPIPLSD
jgi:hypothetical protein